MPVADQGPDKLSIVVFSGQFDRVHYALVMAAAAAASNRPVTLFFTMGAARALENGQGWRRLPVENPAMGDASAVDDGFKSRNVADFETLLSACVDLGIVVMVCEMGLRALDMNAADLRADVPIAQGGVVTFLADASRDGAMLFV